MASYFGEHCFLYSANLSMDLMNLNGHHSSARKLLDTAQCGGWNDIIFVLYHCRRTSRVGEEMRRVEEVSHMFCFQARHLILYYLYLLCNTYCVLLFVDYMMNLEGCISVFESRCFFFFFDFVNVVFWCFCYKPSAVKLVILHINVFGCHCRPLGTCMWYMSCYFIYQCLCYVSHYPWYIICRMFCSFILLFLL